MKKKKFREVEKLVIDYYKNEKEIKFLKKKLVRIEESIKYIKKRMDSSDITLEADIKSPSMGNESGSGFVQSKLDLAIENAYHELENRLAKQIENEIITANRIYELEDNMDILNQYIKTLRFDFREILEKIYKEKESLKSIATNYYGGAIATVHRKRNKALIEIKNMLAWQI